MVGDTKVQDSARSVNLFSIDVTVAARPRFNAYVPEANQKFGVSARVGFQPLIGAGVFGCVVRCGAIAPPFGYSQSTVCCTEFAPRFVNVTLSKWPRRKGNNRRRNSLPKPYEGRKGAQRSSQRVSQLGSRKLTQEVTTRTSGPPPTTPTSYPSVTHQSSFS